MPVPDAALCLCRGQARSVCLEKHQSGTLRLFYHINSCAPSEEISDIDLLALDVAFND